MAVTEAIWTAEEVFVRWWLHHATVSNVELAHISNVNRRWRQAAQRAIVEQATEERDPQRIKVHERGNGEERRLLLLPSMVRFLHSHIRGQPPLDSHSGIVDTPDTFCAAWFHPDGIQEERISLSGKMTTAEEEDDETTLTHSQHSSNYNATSQFVPSGGDGQTYALSGDDDEDEVRSRGSRKELQRDSQRSRSPAAASLLNTQSHQRTPPNTSLHHPNDSVATCAEWRGYHSAAQVLRPFGYSKLFIRDVLSSTAEHSDTTLSYLDEDSVLGLTYHPNGPQHVIPIRDPTFAVRGAVIARPESYCYCVDSDVERLKSLRLVAASGSVTPYTTDNGGSSTGEYNEIRRQEYKQSLLRKERRRRELQRDVLPRILTRTTLPLNGTNDGEIKSGTAPHTTRSVQFLNAAGSHAVCMMTPPFACGQLVEPVTVFCVGIATEDGCFLSGLHRRFELGHLYPDDEVAEATELSPVCIATERGDVMIVDGDMMNGQQRTLEGEFLMDTSANTRGSNNGTLSHSRKDDHDDEDDEDDHDNDGDSSCDGSDDEISSSGHQKCTCIFHGVGEKLSALDEEKPRRIHRGRLGPGQWHCYVAIFDGESSVIRVDGTPEPMQSDTMPKSIDDPKQTSAKSTTRQSPATLDGLTIGSDHCFGMSLCCGNGSGGEGEGAIAELAVFHGRLDLADIQVLEQELMMRHGIPMLPRHDGKDDGKLLTTPQLLNSEANSEMIWRENEWARQAHALFFLPDLRSTSRSKKSKSKPPLPQIPLRFLSRHRSVAWKQNNPVTGEPISIKRIGCKPGASSSDL